MQVSATMQRASHAALAAGLSLWVGACATAEAPPPAAAAQWRLTALASADSAPSMKAAAAGILAYLQDSPSGRSRAASPRPLCLGAGPASGGPFRMQPLSDLDPALLAQIVATHRNARDVSQCATTLKGSPYRIEATGEPADLVACLISGSSAPGTEAVLCGFYDSPISAEFIGYDVEIASGDVLVRRNGRRLAF